MVWRTFSSVAFVAALFEALKAFIEVFAPLLRLINEGFLLVWCLHVVGVFGLLSFADVLRSGSSKTDATNGQHRFV